MFSYLRISAIAVAAMTISCLLHGNDLGKERFNMCKQRQSACSRLLIIGRFAGVGLKAWFEDDDSCLQSCDISQQHYTETCPAAAPVQHFSQHLCEEDSYSQLSTHMPPSEDDLNQCRYHDIQYMGCVTSILCSLLDRQVCTQLLDRSNRKGHACAHKWSL